MKGKTAIVTGGSKGIGRAIAEGLLREGANVFICARDKSTLKRALEEPMRQIANNAGAEGAMVLQRAKSEKGNIGFDANTGAWVDMVETGILDPTKVTRSALQNAASVAALLLTTEALITELPDEEHPMPGGHGPHGMGGDMDF